MITRNKPVPPGGIGLIGPEWTKEVLGSEAWDIGEGGERAAKAVLEDLGFRIIPYRDYPPQLFGLISSFDFYCTREARTETLDVLSDTPNPRPELGRLLPVSRTERWVIEAKATRQESRQVRIGNEFKLTRAQLVVGWVLANRCYFKVGLVRVNLRDHTYVLTELFSNLRDALEAKLPDRKVDMRISQENVLARGEIPSRRG